MLASVKPRVFVNRSCLDLAQNVLLSGFIPSIHLRPK